MAKILITNNHLVRYGGTETWVITMAKELEMMGHNVGVYSKIKGGLYDTLKWKDDNPKDYDLALINHNVNMGVDAKFKIFTSHGVIPELERPVAGADAYVAVSEEIALRYSDYNMLVIRNPINIYGTHAFNPPNKELHNILFMSNNPLLVLPIVKEATKGYGLTVLSGGREMSEPYIRNADLVITLGRGAYESLACGKNVLVYDYNGGDGLLNPLNIKEIRKNNCSGRRHSKQYTAPELRQEIERYNPYNAIEMRKYIVDNHDVRKIAAQYLEIYFKKSVLQ